MQMSKNFIVSLETIYSSLDVGVIHNDRVENCIVMYRGHEVKEALRAQMEVQSKLHLLVEVNFLFMVHGVLLFWLY